MPIIPIAIQVLKTGFRYRKQIYAVITAQDRAIKGAFVGTRISKAAQYGWRTGAGAGGLLGSLNNYNADDTPGNGVQKTISKQTPSSKPHKTRGGQTVSYQRRNKRSYYSRCRKR